MFIPDLSRQTYCPWVHEKLLCFSVGWLGDSVPQSGTVSPEIMRLLSHCAEHHAWHDGFLGKHACEICGTADSHGEFWIELFDEGIRQQVRFVLPLGVFHYITEHGYCPPQEFLNAVEPLARKLQATMA